MANSPVFISKQNNLRMADFSIFSNMTYQLKIGLKAVEAISSVLIYVFVQGFFLKSLKCDV